MSCDEWSIKFAPDGTELRPGTATGARALFLARCHRCVYQATLDDRRGQLGLRGLCGHLFRTLCTYSIQTRNQYSSVRTQGKIDRVRYVSSGSFNRDRGNVLGGQRAPRDIKRYHWVLTLTADVEIPLHGCERKARCSSDNQRDAI